MGDSERRLAVVAEEKGVTLDDVAAGQLAIRRRTFICTFPNELLPTSTSDTVARL